ncbi:hypothetical protein IE81DRAFT_348480 [Ceraceosorus guamensis]|uniref:Uncharacterized protein n=1 Tax=Ceraceosorus guamensis TaxID=1522189 RepID=A0A316VVB5_9BASI|nr:hypothetical protein IE81DRAFT_348480 [Ceraceosorus guamensis]PWN41224.1 hypothetical protein IE81DRAFT_348480 [Ceraceosorus guamensis]
MLQGGPQQAVRHTLQSFRREAQAVRSRGSQPQRLYLHALERRILQKIGQTLGQMSKRQSAFKSPAIGALFQANKRRKADISKQYATRCKAFAERLELCAQEAHDLCEFKAAKAKSAIPGRLEANQRNLYFTKAIAPSSAALMSLPSAALTELV